MTELGLEPQAAIFRRALAMLEEPYIRDNGRRRDIRFKGEWSDRDERLSKLTDEFYAIGGGARAVPIKGDIACEGGPGLRDAMFALCASEEHAALLNPADGLQPCARMDFRLRQHRRLGAEALDDRAHERPHAG
jgi:hypothetical protein